MDALTYSYTRQNFADVMRRVNDDCMPVVVTSLRGKPEPLKHHLSGFWSRRIDHCLRLVYGIENETILIAQCRDHY